MNSWNHLSICPCVLYLQVAAKMGGDQMPNMNSSAVIDPSLYGFVSQNRSLDNGGKSSLSLWNQKVLSTFLILSWKKHSNLIDLN